jgi:hypothetical protein
LERVVTNAKQNAKQNAYLPLAFSSLINHFEETYDEIIKMAATQDWSSAAWPVADAALETELLDLVQACQRKFCAVRVSRLPLTTVLSFLFDVV